MRFSFECYTYQSNQSFQLNCVRGVQMELKLTFLSHAALMLEGEFGKLVCDPWILNEPVFNLSTWKFPPAIIPPEVVVADIDYLLITHSHEDHFHIPSLNYFPREVKVILSAFDKHASLRANTIEIVLRKMGFHNIRKLRAWETYLLSGKTPLTCIPHANSRERDWENMGFVLEHPDCTLFNINDNVNDEALCKAVKTRFPKIDIGLIQTGGVTMFPGCFRMSHDKMKQEAEARKLAFREQRRMLDFVQPDIIVPFAGDFCWLADQYFHNNWANRTTPTLFKQMIETHYAHTGVELLYLQPGDEWTKATGKKEKMRRVNWDNMLGEMEHLQSIYRNKLNAIESYLHDVDLSDLKNRSIWHTKNIETFITRDFIDFSARFRIQIEGEHSNFSFVTKATPETYFQVDWEDDAPVDQTLYVPEHIWACILEGKLMFNIIQWVAQAEQGAYRLDMGKLWFWMEYHIDLNNKNIQVNISERLFQDTGTYCEPEKASFQQPDEWELAARFYST